MPHIDSNLVVHASDGRIRRVSPIEVDAHRSAVSSATYYIRVRYEPNIRQYGLIAPFGA